MLVGGFLVMAVLVMALVLIEARPTTPRWQYGVVKMCAAAVFLVVGARVVSDVPDAPAARPLFLAALAFAALGDLLLIPTGHKRVFFVGLFAFLTAHALFIPAFVARGVDVPLALGALLVLLAPATVVLRWLRRHVKGTMWPPIVAYVVVITTMVAASFGAVVHGLTHTAGATPALLLGAMAFWLSDVCVARQRFVSPAFANKLFGVPLYFFAQLGLIAGTAG